MAIHSPPVQPVPTSGGHAAARTVAAPPATRKTAQRRVTTGSVAQRRPPHTSASGADGTGHEASGRRSCTEIPSLLPGVDRHAPALLPVDLLHDHGRARAGRVRSGRAARRDGPATAAGA